MVALRTRYSCVDPNHPEAAAICDRGGEVRRRSELLREMIYAGGRLQWNGFLVCREHIDRPHPQDRSKILPADPVPVINPRPPQPMPPLPGLVTTGTTNPLQTADVVTDQIGAPVYDHSGAYQAAEMFDGQQPSLAASGRAGTSTPVLTPSMLDQDTQGRTIEDSEGQPVTLSGYFEQ